MATFADQAFQVLDLTKELDVTLLDQIVTCFYSSVGPEVNLYVNLSSAITCIYVLHHCTDY